MGCAPGKEDKKPNGKDKSGESEVRQDTAGSAASVGKLLDKYTLGKVLGQGAFGVVYKCKRKGTDEEYAVKMIDQVETPLSEIKKEVEMLYKLAHPTCIKMHDVFYEKVFVCMVLELYRGGDMIQGMMAHWKAKGMIPINTTKLLGKQMNVAVGFLHQKKCVHRDVKGDNFMMHYSNVENPQQRIYLSDFGTVREVADGERLSQKCGTKNYWSPELYKQDYGLKVDCWAVGVIMFGLVSGKFPFKSEDDVMNKNLVIPKRCPEDGQQVIHSLLTRNEGKRLDCKAAADMPFFSEIGSIPGIKEDFDKDFSPDIKETGANAGVAQRRAELVDRLQAAGNDRIGDRRSYVVSMNDTGKGFSITDPVTERSTAFEWWDASRCSTMIDVFKDAPKVESFENREVTEDSVKQQLLDHGVKVTGFGKAPAKQFSEFVNELQTGACKLLLDATKHKFMVRAVDIVLMCITDNSGERYIVEVTEGIQEGQTKQGPALPGSYKLPHENAVQAATRLSKDMLGLDCKIQWDICGVEVFEETENNPGYPGIQTVYRNEIIRGEVATGVIAQGKTSFSSQHGGRTRNFAVWTADQVSKKRVKTCVAKDKVDFSALVHPPIGLEVEELNDFLTKNNIDTKLWGTGTFRTLDDFSKELVKGESTLIKQPNGNITRVVDIVVMALTRQETGEVLMETKETLKDAITQLDRLPAIKRRSDENVFNTARRMVIKYLKMDDNRVTLDIHDVKIVESSEESKAYSGLHTIYRKRFMKATLLPADI